MQFRAGLRQNSGHAQKRVLFRSVGEEEEQITPVLIQEHQNSSAESDQRSVLPSVKSEDNSCNLICREEQEQDMQIEQGIPPYTLQLLST